jgi:hypothetical protein
MPPFNLLSTTRINAIIQALIDVRQLPGQLLFSRRVPTVPATDAEILARYVQYWQIADIIADDQEAGVYNSGALTYETTNIPNLKHGTKLTQEFLNQLQAIAANGGLMNDSGYFSDYENRTIAGLLFGVRQRTEALIIAMMLDSLTYNRLGIQMSGVSWGTPADLKVTPSTTWVTANAATATPVADVLTLKRLGAVRYGENWNRITMSTSAFIAMTGTTEFQNRARYVLPPSMSTAILPTMNIADMREIAMRILGVGEIVLYDWRAWTHNSDGSFASAALLPIGEVILDDSSYDGDTQVWDVANSIVTESVVSSLVGAQNGGGVSGMLGGFGGPVRGPVAYATAKSDLNPPGLIYWAVARQFPRKRRLSANAVIHSGVTTDTIAVGPPY